MVFVENRTANDSYKVYEEDPDAGVQTTIPGPGGGNTESPDGWVGAVDQFGNHIQGKRELLMPRCRFRPGPRLRPEISQRTLGCCLANDLTLAIVPSVEPSSTTMTSFGGAVWLRTEEIDRSMVPALLKDVITQQTSTSVRWLPRMDRRKRYRRRALDDLRRRRSFCEGDRTIPVSWRTRSCWLSRFFRAKQNS